MGQMYAGQDYLPFFFLTLYTTLSVSVVIMNCVHPKRYASVEE